MSPIESDYINKRNEVIKIIENYSSLDDWSILKQDQSNTIVYSKKSSEWNGTIFKIEGPINACPEIVRKYVCPRIKNGPRSKWDSAIQNIRCIQTVNDTTDVLNFSTPSHVGGLIAERDFVELVFHHNSETYAATMSVSVEHDECPAKHKIVRAQNFPSAMVCHKDPSDPLKTKLTMYVQTNPRGSYLIRVLSEKAIPSIMSKFMEELRAAISNDFKHIESPPAEINGIANSIEVGEDASTAKL